MKLHDLHVMMTVVEAGSMNKAAALLNTTQPAISRSIAELERSLGVRVLDRDQRGVAPTEYGRALLNRCVTVFDELRQGVKSIEHLADATAGEIRVGATGATSAGFVSAVVDHLSRQHPRISIHIEDEETEGLQDQLHQRNLDLLILRQSPAVVDERVNFEILFSDSYVVVAGLEHPSIRRRRVGLAELVNERWAMPLPRTTAASVARQAFRTSRLDFPHAAVCATPEVRIKLVATGRFLSIFSELRLHQAQSPTKILPVRLPTAPVPTGIIRLKNRTLSPAVQLFIDAARKIAEPLAKRTSPADVGSWHIADIEARHTDVRFEE
jgi:DNA-binding transcriptional LysR family regulator